jgi:hypothetical protein
LRYATRTAPKSNRHIDKNFGGWGVNQRMPPWNAGEWAIPLSNGYLREDFAIRFDDE